jgi:hypothetical protein
VGIEEEGRGPTSFAGLGPFVLSSLALVQTPRSY